MHSQVGAGYWSFKGGETRRFEKSNGKEMMKKTAKACVLDMKHDTVLLSCARPRLGVR